MAGNGFTHIRGRPHHLSRVANLFRCMPRLPPPGASDLDLPFASTCGWSFGLSDKWTPGETADLQKRGREGRFPRGEPKTQTAGAGVVEIMEDQT